MVIHDGEYLLRSFTVEDGAVFYDISHDDLIKKYVPYAYSKNKEISNQTVKDYSFGDCVNDFYLLIEKSGVSVGAIIAVRMQSKSLDISYLVSKEFRGQGIMKAAMKIFINWLKQNTDYERLTLLIEKENLPSNKLSLKLGGVYKCDVDKRNLYHIYLK